MRSLMLRRAIAASLFLSASSFAFLPAHAETTLCTVLSTFPATISSPGVYCLESDPSLSISTGAAITINANNVTLDLNSHRLGALAAGTATQAIGIYALNHTNITIKNGIVRGFAVGIENY